MFDRLLRYLKRRDMLREAAALDRVADAAHLRYRLVAEVEGWRPWLVAEVEKDARAKARILREEAERLA